jgi:hypothetical protein
VELKLFGLLEDLKKKILLNPLVTKVKELEVVMMNSVEYQNLINDRKSLLQLKVVRDYLNAYNALNDYLEEICKGIFKDLVPDLEINNPFLCE